MKSFQKSLSSHIQLNRLFNNITEVEDLVNETESEAKCTKSLVSAISYVNLDLMINYFHNIPLFLRLLLLLAFLLMLF